MSNLEEFYKGDNHWKEFVKLFDNELESFDSKKELLVELNFNIDLAKVIFGIHKESSLNWIDKKIPALNNLSVKDCLHSELLCKRLKTMLMRMPR